MSQISTEKIESKISQDIISKTQDNTPPKKARKYSSASSDSESFLSNINAEIKNFIENEENNLSFSSNSDQESPYKKSDIDYLLDSRFWKASNISSYDTEYNQEKKIFGKCLKKSAKKELDVSNKQSTQENEEDEMRDEHMQSSMESNNSHLNVLINNESIENNNIEINCEKEEKNGSVENNNFSENVVNKDDANKLSENQDNIKDISNLIGTNILLNGNNFSNNIGYNNVTSDSKFIFPYEQINYLPNQAGSNYYPNSYIPQNYINFSSKYNLSSPLASRNIISLNNDCKLSKNLSEKNSPDHNSEQNVKNEIINGQINKFSNTTNNDFSKKLNQNHKESVDLPLILNQNNSQNMSNINYNVPKLNLNMTYYPKIQNRSIQLHKQSMDKSNNVNLLPELKDINNNSNNSNTNYVYQDKLVKNNNNIEANNLKNPINNYIYQNNKLKQCFNKNLQNNNIKGQKGEKQFLNLDDIASGKDTRTTIMIRNIPIKYTDDILNETFKEFHGKYDCLYMPYDYEKNGNKGYAFINFVNPLHILLFYEKFNGKKWMHFESNKICELNLAHFQGVNEIQKHAKNFKGLKKSCISNTNENIIIPSKYLSKIKNRFPNMKYENKNKKEFVVKSFV